MWGKGDGNVGTGKGSLKLGIAPPSFVLGINGQGHGSN